MIINGIVAEYNPFHKGHQYQLEEARRATGADYTIVAMSGNFVQRGAPALIDKYTRAKMALSCGADLVLELPVYYACASAEYFAEGAVSTLDKLGVVNHLCFGSEEGDTEAMQRIARILAEEPEKYAYNLRDNLRRGLSYPNARMQALMAYDERLKEKEALLTSPNNILGIEYLKTLYNRNSSIKTYTTKRMGGGYHDTDPNSQYSSASAIRRLLAECYPPTEPGTLSDASHQCYPEDLRTLLADHIPADGLEVLLDAQTAVHARNNKGASNIFLFENNFSAQLHYKLLFESAQGFAKYLDVSEDLSDRICNHLYDFDSFSSFTELLKTKETTHTRISRCLLHILLGITADHMAEYRAIDAVPYARVLGFRKDAAPLLNMIKHNSDIPLITKLADAEKLLSAHYGETETGRLANRMLSEDITINKIYESAVSLQTGCPMRNEYRTPLIML